MSTLLPAVVAAVSALLGVALTTLLQQRAARQDRAEARAHQRQDSALAAVADLAAALDAHRLAMWVREEARLSGADPDRIAGTRAASHETRQAISVPHTRLLVLAPDLDHAATQAITATYALRGAADLPTLARRRAAALDAHRTLTTQARAVLAR
ncbi:protein kilB (plasmid) [Streptomyces sp. JL4002]|uniref:protein kilB n=1 Tax=Streptomyces sp. JL4002 TaxID=3404781 RepID=UPI003B28C3D3